VIIGAKAGETKGRIKEAVGNLTGNDPLEREGKAGRAGSRVKRKVNEAVDKVKGVVGR
jgi:uncharacterized protein YjbJ (UPF0337 family)